MLLVLASSRRNGKVGSPYLNWLETYIALLLLFMVFFIDSYFSMLFLIDLRSSDDSLASSLSAIFKFISVIIFSLLASFTITFCVRDYCRKRFWVMVLKERTLSFSFWRFIGVY